METSQLLFLAVLLCYVLSEVHAGDFPVVIINKVPVQRESYEVSCRAAGDPAPTAIDWTAFTCDDSRCERRQIETDHSTCFSSANGLRCSTTYSVARPTTFLECRAKNIHGYGYNRTTFTAEPSLFLSGDDYEKRASTPTQVRLEVRILSNLPHTEIKWFGTDRRPIVMGDGFAVDSDGFFTRLTIQHATVTRSGTYRVKATSGGLTREADLLREFYEEEPDYFSGWHLAALVGGLIALVVMLILLVVVIRNYCKLKKEMDRMWSPKYRYNTNN